MSSLRSTPEFLKSSHSCFPLFKALSLPSEADLKRRSSAASLSFNFLCRDFTLIVVTATASFGMNLVCLGDDLLHDVSSETADLRIF